jgi:hypothetical protein
LLVRCQRLERRSRKSDKKKARSQALQQAALRRKAKERIFTRLGTAAAEACTRTANCNFGDDTSGSRVVCETSFPIAQWEIELADASAELRQTVGIKDPDFFSFTPPCKCEKHRTELRKAASERR